VVLIFENKGEEFLIPITYKLNNRTTWYSSNTSINANNTNMLFDLEYNNEFDCEIDTLSNTIKLETYAIQNEDELLKNYSSTLKDYHIWSNSVIVKNDEPNKELGITSYITYKYKELILRQSHQITFRNAHFGRQQTTANLHDYIGTGRQTQQFAFYTGKLAFHHLHTSAQRQRKLRQAKGIGRQIDYSHEIVHLFFRHLQQGTGIPVDNIEDRKTSSVGQLASMTFRRPEENQIGNQRYLHLFPSIATDTHSPLGWDEMFFPPLLQPVTHGQLMSFPGTGRKPADTFFDHR
jgi:hypothetical protein